MGEKRKMRGSIVLSIGIFFCLFSSGLSEAQERAGRIFYVTTTTSVSTVNTVSFCHFLSVTDTAIVTCAARKRRMLRLNDQPSDAHLRKLGPPSLISSLHRKTWRRGTGGLSTTGSPPPSPAPPPPSHPPAPLGPSCVLPLVIPITIVRDNLMDKNK